MRSYGLRSAYGAAPWPAERFSECRSRLDEKKRPATSAGRGKERWSHWVLFGGARHRGSPALPRANAVVSGGKSLHIIWLASRFRTKSGGERPRQGCALAGSALD